MAKLLKSRHEVSRALTARIRAGNELTAKAEIAEETWGHRDWLHLLKAWREDTVKDLNDLYKGARESNQFAFIATPGDHSTPQYTFPHAKRALELGITLLQNLVDRLDLAVAESPDATEIQTLHPEILSKCRNLYESGDYVEAVEKSFKLVRDRLRALTSYETGSDAFGRGKLYVDGAAAPHVDEDFQTCVKFLTMAIDRFRNERSHTADGNINDSIRAYEYLT